MNFGVPFFDSHSGVCENCQNHAHYLVCLISSLWIIRRENPMITCAEYPISYVEEEGQTPWNLATSDRQTPVVGIDII